MLIKLNKNNCYVKRFFGVSCSIMDSQVCSYLLWLLYFPDYMDNILLPSSGLSLS